ncbi:MAG: MFS transporter, partial [Deltaproteobacteria bacterium]|nr:MFS transporter [Deltaproteobacteria bacterium]
YHFNSVAALNTAYFASFGAELAVVSMLPAFFEETFSLGPVSSGMSASAFVLASLFARPLGGMLSDRTSSRKNTMAVYMLGITLGFFLMALIDAWWPLALALFVTVICSFFVQGAKGAAFGIIPSVNRRLTGQISGMTAAYGSVGAVFYLTLYTFLSSKQFFFVLAACAFSSFLFCVVFLREPHGGFAEEYHVSPTPREEARGWSGGRER